MRRRDCGDWDAGWSGALVLCLCVCIGCGGPKSPTPRTGTAPKAGFHTVTIGLGEDYPANSRSLEAARGDLLLLKTNNLHCLRISFSWAEMEPQPGSMDWSFWDEFVRQATQAGTRLVPYICYTPKWAAAKPGEEFWRQPPKDTQLFGDFVRRLVERYHEQIHSWEIWNEPDNPEYWSGSTEEFEQLLETGCRAVRETDPTATVVMGGLAWNLDFLQTVLSQAQARTNLDVINLHNYYETWSGEPLERLTEYVGRARDLVSEAGGSQQLWMAEVGYSDFRKGAYVSRTSRAFYNYEHTAKYQGADLFRTLTLLLASGDVSLVTWYRIHDLPSTQAVIGDVNNRYLGVLDEHGQPKPALHALVYFNTLFRDGFRCLDKEVSSHRLLHSSVEAHAFELANGTRVVAVWLKTVVLGERGATPEGQARDAREEKITLTLPRTHARSAAVYDEFGHRLGTCPLARGADGTRTARLRLGGGGVRVLALSPTGSHD